MASRPPDPSSRHVGRIVDPMVREDGELEPELSIEATTSGAVSPPGEQAGEPNDGAGTEARGTSMRERLLARAARAEQHSVTRERDEAADDLDEIGKLGTSAPHADARGGGAARAPGSPLVPTRPALSPTIVALFGTLMGMAVIASVTAIAMHVAPHRDALLETASAAPTLTASAPAPPPQKKAKKRERVRVPGPWRVSEGAHTPGLKLYEGKIGTDAFLKAVQAAGVPLKETYRIVTAFQGLKSFDRCGKSDRFAALVDQKTNRLKAFEYQVSAEEVYQAREGQNGLLEASKLDLKIEHTQVAGALVYDGKSLDDSAEEAGFERGLARVVQKALDGHSSVEELERGDVIRLIVQEVSVLGEFDRYAGVEALEVRRVKGDSLRVYYYDTPGARGYYDTKGRSPHQGGWRKPIPGAPITSHFNLKRLHPILKKITPHLGTDFGAPTGTPIGASAPGTVTYLAFAGPAGNLVRIEHAGGIETGYAHCSRFADGLKVGDTVKRLQVIGYVGSTGRSTGPHLHFSAKKDKAFFDAEKLDLDGMRTLGGGERAGFDIVMAKYNPLLDAIVLPEPLPPEAPPAVTSAPAAASAVAPGSLEPDAEEDDSAAPPPPLPAPPPSGSPTRAGSSIYLSDQELRDLQGATDDGEVSE